MLQMANSEKSFEFYGKFNEIQRYRKGRNKEKWIFSIKNIIK